MLVDLDGVIVDGDYQDRPKPIPFVRSALNYDADYASLMSGVDFTGDLGKTQQEFALEADINEIVRRFGLTGELPENYRTPISGDFTGVSDYQTALNAVLAADAAFMEMPGELRARFDNDPQKLMRFVEDDANRDEAMKLGLLKVVEAVPPMEVRVIADDPPVASS